MHLTTTTLPRYNPPHAPLRADEDHTSFAFITLRDRLPAIITKLIDALHRRRGQGANDHATLIAALAQLRHQLQTNKPLLSSTDDDDNFLAPWQRQISAFPAKWQTWFGAPWLFSECFLYARVYAICRQHHVNFDYFSSHKQAESIHFRAHHAFTEDDFRSVVLGSLWGNQADLSMSAGQTPVARHSDIHAAAESHLLDDYCAQVLAYLERQHPSEHPIIFVLDNAGTELYHDMCLADWLLTHHHTTRIIFHAKQIPWFVSDVLKHDVDWLLERAPQELRQRWREYLETGRFMVRDHPFWTTHHPYAHLQHVAPDLHAELTSALLVIFKGDLNYRKIMYDCQWPHSTPFSEVVRPWCHFPILALRTCKANVVVGIPESRVRQLDSEQPNVMSKGWLVNGQFGVLQFFNPQQAE